MLCINNLDLDFRLGLVIPNTLDLTFGDLWIGTLNLDWGLSFPDRFDCKSGLFLASFKTYKINKPYDKVLGAAQFTNV